MVKLDVDDVLLWVGEVDGKMLQALGEFSYTALKKRHLSDLKVRAYLEDPRQ